MLKPLTPTRCLVLLACISWMLIFSLGPRFNLLETHEVVHQPAPRDLLPLAEPSGSSSAEAAPSGGGASPTSQPSPPPPSSPPPSSAPPQSSSSSSSSDSSSSSSSSASSESTSSTPTTTSSPAPTSQPPTQAQPTPTPTVSQILSTDADGGTITIQITITPTPSLPAPSTSAGADQSGGGGGGGGSKSVGTSTIVGLSVAGGIALVGIIGFIVWKFTRKRFSDDFDDSEAIKWPELNTHGDPHALQVNRTGGTGFETNSEVNLTRPDSLSGSTYAASAAASAVDLYAPNAAHDPYAVPPLPHLNPNQPYRDEPDGAYYDPYHGPVPQTFGEGVPPHEIGAEAIPMTQINRSRSPGPQMAYDAGRRSPGPGPAYMGEMGRSSPGPRAMSPGPAAALSGRVSPGPQAAYGYGGRQSPGPHMAYGS